MYQAMVRYNSTKKLVYLSKQFKSRRWYLCFRCCVIWSGGYNMVVMETTSLTCFVTTSCKLLRLVIVFNFTSAHRLFKGSQNHC